MSISAKPSHNEHMFNDTLINNSDHDHNVHTHNNATCTYGQFSVFQKYFCGLDPGNSKFETVRTNKQRICFQDLRPSI